MMGVFNLVNHPRVERAKITDKAALRALHKKDRTFRQTFQEFMSHPIASRHKCQGKWNKVRAWGARKLGNETAETLFKEKNQKHKVASETLIRESDERQAEKLQKKLDPARFMENRFDAEFMHANPDCYGAVAGSMLKLSKRLHNFKPLILSANTNLGRCVGHLFRKGYESVRMRSGSWLMSRWAGHAIGITVFGAALFCASSGLSKLMPTSFAKLGMYSIFFVGQGFLYAVVNTVAHSIDLVAQGYCMGKLKLKHVRGMEDDWPKRFLEKTQARTANQGRGEASQNPASVQTEQDIRTLQVDSESRKSSVVAGTAQKPVALPENNEDELPGLSGPRHIFNPLFVGKPSGARVAP
ncbi:MAG: hypothetical protein HC848_03305 [Limnobacter sp.]|nr:hypothetical protein [Limnobacter sp.]